ncbi:translation initiation factor eIF-2B subunit beta [Plectosphaerella plurivora]|uniref:Translation initiation factor eIF2B subunit beta n=1 Tax=Plectosphaerella plurivora TaxID=936078 RepID=A0A9P9AI37_9PEZI|nr:translation initiation factor eIF-2B subunit beta [Plectosphaerella plurivora]
MAAVKVSISELERYLKSLKGKPLDASIDSLISLLKRRQVQGSEACAVATAHILLQVVAKTKFLDADHMLERVQQVGCRLVSAQPRELAIGNIVRRVLGLIRDEAAEDRNEGGDGDDDDDDDDVALTPSAAVPDPSKHNNQFPASTYAKQDAGADYISSGPRPVRPGALTSVSSFSVPKTLLSLLEAAPSALTPSVGSLRDSGTSTPMRGPQNTKINALRSEVIDGIEEIKDEISQADDQIASSAEVQIHPKDYVLVHQPSPTVQKFILRAATRRRFTVLIATEPPRDVTDEAPYASFRRKLAGVGIDSINIMNGGLTAHMSRISKVILGARSVLANGAVVTDAGAGLIARAAKERGNPVIVLSGVYKLSPESAATEESLIEWGSSMSQVSFADGSLVNGVEVRSAVTELVPPELVDTYITNLGAHSRNHLSSIIADHYKPEDVDFQLWK